LKFVRCIKVDKAGKSEEFLFDIESQLQPYDLFNKINTFHHKTHQELYKIIHSSAVKVNE